MAALGAHEELVKVTIELIDKPDGNVDIRVHREGDVPSKPTPAMLLTMVAFNAMKAESDALVVRGVPGMPGIGAVIPGGPS